LELPGYRVRMVRLVLREVPDCKALLVWPVLPELRAQRGCPE